MNVKNEHKFLRLQPISSATANSKNYRTITAQLTTPHDPPTYIKRPEKLTIDDMLQAATSRRPNAETPTASTWHLRMGCAGVKVLKHARVNVNGMMVQKGSWDALAKMLPCSGCAAGKMRKSHKLKPTDFTELSNMLTEACHNEPDDTQQIPVFPLSRTAATAEQVTERNKLVACDWKIVNVKSKKGNTVFALYLDVHTGIAFVHCAPSRGEAAGALDAYCQTWGIPSELIHNNAVEFLKGTFQMRCRERGIKQSPSPPYAPNYNPSERHMDIIVSGARSLPFISGLDPQLFWDDAVEYRVQFQLVMALPGRPIPWELALGQRPDLTFIRTMGCEALSCVEKDKRWKFDPKVERCIYLGISPLHSKDAYKLRHLFSQ
jgi:hypothetical protein